MEKNSQGSSPEIACAIQKKWHQLSDEVKTLYSVPFPCDSSTGGCCHLNSCSFLEIKNSSATNFAQGGC
jgi:hypothetical protein